MQSRNRTNIIQLLLKHQNTDPNIQNNHKETPLHIAARKGYLDILKCLLASGANANLPGDFEDTVLHKAIWNRHLECIKYLLENGASLNAEDKYSKNAINTLKYWIKNTKKEISSADREICIEIMRILEQSTLERITVSQLASP